MADNSNLSLDHEGDDSPLAEEGRHSRVDERTLYGTPAPMAASTVARNEQGTER